jgi:hypothetical protein
MLTSSVVLFHEFVSTYSCSHSSTAGVFQLGVVRHNASIPVLSSLGTYIFFNIIFVSCCLLH